VGKGGRADGGRIYWRLLCAMCVSPLTGANALKILAVLPSCNPAAWQGGQWGRGEGRTGVGSTGVSCVPCVSLLSLVQMHSTSLMMWHGPCAPQRLLGQSASCTAQQPSPTAHPFLGMNTRCAPPSPSCLQVRGVPDHRHHPGLWLHHRLLAGGVPEARMAHVQGLPVCRCARAGGWQPPRLALCASCMLRLLTSEHAAGSWVALPLVYARVS